MDTTKFAPENLGNLTDADITAMQNFTDEELGELAKAYPNKATGNNYLLLFDTTIADNRQTFPQSSYAILFSLRKKHGQKNLRIHVPTVKAHKQPAQPVTAPPQDLTPEQVLKAKEAAKKLAGGKTLTPVTGGKEDDANKGKETDNGGNENKGKEDESGNNDGNKTIVNEPIKTKDQPDVKKAVDLVKLAETVESLRALVEGDERPQILTAVAAQMKKLNTPQQ